MVRGEILRLPAPRRPRGHVQAGPRLGVVVQADHLMGLSTVLLAPTSTSARPASFRPVIEVAGVTTRVLVEQTRAVDPQRLGPSVGRLAAHELAAVDDALLVMLDL